MRLGAEVAADPKSQPVGRAAPRGVLSDIHGVLYVYPHALPGSVEASERLAASGLPHAYLTNSTQHPKAWILRSLQDAGFKIQSHEVLTAAEAAGAFLRARGLSRIGWLANPELAEDVPEVEIVLPESTQDHVDAVLVGDLGPRFTYDTLNAAFRWLRGGASLVALARNRCYQSADGIVLDSGPYVALLEYATQVSAEVVGKPAPEFFRAGLDRVGLPAGQVTMIGDDLDGDVLPAVALGMEGVLVGTGKVGPAERARVVNTPARLVSDFAAAVDGILSPNGA